MASPSIQRIERMNYVLAGAITLASLALGSRSITLGVAIGAALTSLNFYILRRLIVKWTSAAAQGKASNAPLLMLPKMLGLMGACAFAILLLPIDAIAFAAGYSIFIISIVLEGIYSALRATPSDENSHG
jgi:hypothetical protein